MATARMYPVCMCIHRMELIFESLYRRLAVDLVKLEKQQNSSSNRHPDHTLDIIRYVANLF